MARAGKVEQKPTINPINPRTAEVKYTGSEPEWHVQPTDDRVSKLTSAFSWYNYNLSKKEVKEFIVHWLNYNNRDKEAKLFESVTDSNIVNAHGWLARMSLMGLQLSEHEDHVLNNTVANNIKLLKKNKEEKITKKVEKDDNKPTIQDRLQEKVLECAAEIDAMFDEFINSDTKQLSNYKPISLMRSMNVAPQYVKNIADIWQKQLVEFKEVLKGDDAQLVEGYSYLTKTQVKNVIKFIEQVITDCGSYVQLKKVERKPRAKKVVSPEKLASKFKYAKEFSELNIKSEAPSKLVNASEAWLYDTKKRKLIYVVDLI
jgi:hypothetical protein